jgi:hypothetical protein
MCSWLQRRLVVTVAGASGKGEKVSAGRWHFWRTVVFGFALGVLSAGILPGGADGISAKQTLAPENHPSLVGVCSTPIVPGHNGSVAALFCRGNEINMKAWSYLVHDDSGLMTLGHSASWHQIVRASCHAKRGTTTPAVLAIYQLTSAYNGWRYGTTPQRVLELGARSACDGT